MSLIRSTRARFVAGITALLVAGSFGVAAASSSDSPMDSMSNAKEVGQGVDEFGLTFANFKGDTLKFKYTKGFFCDTAVAAQSSTGCEVGEKWQNAPAAHFDPLYVVVPLGFDVPMRTMECPSGLVCVDHPGTLDLTRIEPALKPLYPDLTDEQLTEALKDFATPGHNHFITDTNEGKPEWWDVRVVGVTDPAVYQNILDHKSAGYLLKQVKAEKTTPVLKSNLFLFFSVR